MTFFPFSLFWLISKSFNINFYDPSTQFLGLSLIEKWYDEIPWFPEFATTCTNSWSWNAYFVSRKWALLSENWPRTNVCANFCHKCGLFMIFFLLGIFWLLCLGNWLLPGLGIFGLGPCGMLTDFVFRGDRGISGGKNCPLGGTQVDTWLSAWKNREKKSKSICCSFFYKNRITFLTFFYLYIRTRAY